MANVLLAEDDISMRQFLTAALERAGHSVTPCENGIQALDCAESYRNYDLLLADIIMPGMDGIELSQRAMEAIPGLKVMFITGFAGIAASMGPKDMTAKTMSKPFHLRDVVDQVDTVLAS